MSSSRCTPSQTVRAQRKSISNSVKVHRRYQKKTCTSLDVMLEGQIEDDWKLKMTGTWMVKKNRQMHGQDSQDSFH